MGRKSLVLTHLPNTLTLMLTADDKAVLEFERAWWHQPGPKDQAIEFTLGLSAADYYERLLGLLDRSAAMDHDPLTVRRVKAMIVSSEAILVGEVG